MDNNLVLGPLSYSHVVQKITIEEQRAVDSLRTTRTGKNFIVDSGESIQRAKIDLLFTGIDEINKGLRALIALFKISPIISVKNEMISSSWYRPNQIYDEENYKKILEFIDKNNKIFNDSVSRNNNQKSSVVSNWWIARSNNSTATVDHLLKEELYSKINDVRNLTAYGRALNHLNSLAKSTVTDMAAFGIGTTQAIPFLKKNKIYTNYIPVALDSISLKSVDEIPFAIQATIVISRIDVDYIADGDLLYQGSNRNSFNPDPRSAFWLKKWIDTVLKSGVIPILTEDDFKSITIEWFGQTLAGNEIETITNSKAKFDNKRLVFNDSSCSKVLSESCRLHHYFGYNKLIGKSVASAHHMGTSARMYSLDILFNNQQSDKEFRDFCKFKETSDEIVRSVDRLDRINGWEVKSPITKLLYVNTLSKYKESTIKRTDTVGVFIPLHTSIDTTQDPFVKVARLDLAENDVNYLSDQEPNIVSGGTATSDLKKFFMETVIPRELTFRKKLNTNPKETAKSLSGQGTEALTSEAEMFRLFWPFTKIDSTFSKTSVLGLLNTDTLRAAFINSKNVNGREIQAALKDTLLATGSAIIGTVGPGFITRSRLNIDQIKKTLFNVDPETNEEITLYNLIQRQVKANFISSSEISDPNQDSIQSIITDRIYEGLLGDKASGTSLSSSTEEAIAKLVNSTLEFSREFKEALFDVIIDRAEPSSSIPNSYSVEGLYSAFFKLSSHYLLFLDTNHSLHNEKDPLRFKNASNNMYRGSLYPDLLLPTYIELFGEDWESFAPTYSDLGLINLNSEGSQEEYNINEIQDEICVYPNDTVDPHVWFYSKRMKPELLEVIDSGSKVSSSAMHGLSLSIPFNIDDIKQVEEILKTEKPDQNGNYSNKTLVSIIRSALLKHKKEDPEAFRQDINSLRLASKDLYSDMLKNKGIKVYVHNNNNYAVPYRVTMPGLGGELYRVASELNLINRSDVGELTIDKLDADVSYRSASDSTEFEYIRHLDENFRKTVVSSINQIPDNTRSASRLFPAAKVYLIERKGNDIIADDLVSSANSIISIDITQDKDDADLAVIRLADPLYLLQNSYFPRSNTMTVLDQESKQLTEFAFLNPKAEDSYIKGYKITQGRAIQIRMGYGSIAKNLPVVFTGRITEVSPGEVLTIVAQGWKAELINRQVTFYNDNPRNWGAKDLVVQAIQQSEPDGFGQWFPQYTTDFLLQYLNKLDQLDMLNHVISTNYDVDSINGSRGIVNSAANYLVTKLGLRSLDQKDKGIDTRLKNIWYPDTVKYNNFLNLRSHFGFVPAFVNDGWVIPLQPAWEVIKQASRHAWNCIAQVVPYDNEATLFFGHPDQPYFWTRGESISKSRWKKYIDKVNNNNSATIEEIRQAFIESEYYSKQEDNLPIADIINGVLSNKLKLEDLPIEHRKRFEAAIRNSFYATNPDTALTTHDSYISFKNSNKSCEESGLPLAAYRSLQNIYGNRTSAILLELIFGINRNNIQLYWSSVDSDMEYLLSPNSAKNESRIYSIASSLGSINPEQLTVQLEFIIGRLKLLSSAITSLRNVKKPTDLAFSEYSTVSQIAKSIELRLKSISRIGDIDTNVKLYSAIEQIKSVQQVIKNLDFIQASDIITASTKELEVLLASKESKSEFLIKGNINQPLSELLLTNLNLLKAFVYYFNSFITSTNKGREISKILKAQYKSILPGNMRSFRVHHYISDTQDIIKNTIVATTAEMWNTAVIEHPAQGQSENIIPSEDGLTRNNTFYSAIKWNYYPKQEVTGVIGLQFNPGLTLSNKKINIATELNCHSEELAAKLACVHLADGIKKMYRGSLIIKGRNIKPYDRIILDDQYTFMTGPLEVESLVHHYNPNQGWITNILPQAVCDANPGASIIQTGLLEASYRKVFNSIDFISDAITLALILSTLGGASISAGSTNIIASGIKNILKEESKGGSALILRKLFKRGLNSAKILGKDILLASKGNPKQLLYLLYKNTGGLVNAYAKNVTYSALADQLTHFSFQMNVIAGFVQSASKVDQLPVILSPLMYNGLPFTAGLETDDALFSVFTNGTYYSYRDLQQAASKVIDEIFGTDKIGFDK